MKTIIAKQDISIGIIGFGILLFLGFLMFSNSHRIRKTKAIHYTIHAEDSIIVIYEGERLVQLMDYDNCLGEILKKDQQQKVNR